MYSRNAIKHFKAKLYPTEPLKARKVNYSYIFNNSRYRYIIFDSLFTFIIKKFKIVTVYLELVW